MEARSRKTLKILGENLRFLKKTTPYGEILKILLRKDSSGHRSTYVMFKFRENKISSGFPAVATAALRGSR